MLILQTIQIKMNSHNRDETMRKILLSFGWDYGQKDGYIKNRLDFLRTPRSDQLEMIDSAIRELTRIKSLLVQPASCAAHKQALSDLAIADRAFETHETS